MFSVRERKDHKGRYVFFGNRLIAAILIFGCKQIFCVRLFKNREETEKSRRQQRGSVISAVCKKPHAETECLFREFLNP